MSGAEQFGFEFNFDAAPARRVFTVGELSESMLPEDQMFDTNYHPMRTAAIARTQRLLVHLAPHLRPAAK